MPGSAGGSGDQVREVTVSEHAASPRDPVGGQRNFVVALVDLFTFLFVMRFTERPLHFFLGEGPFLAFFAWTSSMIPYSLASMADK